MNPPYLLSLPIFHKFVAHFPNRHFTLSQRLLEELERVDVMGQHSRNLQPFLVPYLLQTIHDV